MRYGISVWSQLPLELVDSELIDWTPLQGSEQYRGAWGDRHPIALKNFPRYVSLFKVSAGDQQFYLAPFHACQPWSLMELDEWRWRVGISVVLGNDNPVFHQLMRYRNWLKSHTQGKNLVIAGDFNIPDRVYRIRPRAYQILSKNWQSFFGGRREATFPTQTIRQRGFNHPQLAIDHAFYSRETEIIAESAQLLPLVGSDHYPIFVSFKLTGQ